MPPTKLAAPARLLDRAAASLIGYLLRHRYQRRGGKRSSLDGRPRTNEKPEAHRRNGKAHSHIQHV
jgi:hypothetical protein